MHKFGSWVKDIAISLIVPPPIQVSLFPSYHSYFLSFSAEYEQNLHLLLKQLCWQDPFGTNFVVFS